MKPSTHLQLPPRDDNEENDDKDDCAAAMSPVNGGDWCVGSRVERELDGLWFPATIVARDADGLFEIEYDEDHNREMYISEEELRYYDASRAKTPTCRPPLTAQQREMMLKDSLLLQPIDYDPNKAPTVILHHQGESNAVSSGYVINGLENNIAAGNGLRGIRWLRDNTL